MLVIDSSWRIDLRGPIGWRVAVEARPGPKLRIGAINGFQLPAIDFSKWPEGLLECEDGRAWQRRGGAPKGMSIMLTAREDLDNRLHGSKT